MIFAKDLNIQTGIAFKDVSLLLNDFQRDTLDLTLPVGEFIFIGLYKVFNTLYWEIDNPPTTAPTLLTAEYYDGNAWQILPVIDETLVTSRSGFIKWDKPSDWVETDNGSGDTLFWVRFSYDAELIVRLKAINILYSNDNQLRAELQSIDKYLAQGQKSFAPSHENVRDDIVQNLRNKFKIKYGKNGKFEQLNKWDILSIDEIKLASKYFVLEKIFFQASATPGDKFHQRQIECKEMANKAFDLAFLSLDLNDSGIDEGQTDIEQFIQVQRI